jgi:hypothetical protein
VTFGADPDVLRAARITSTGNLLDPGGDLIEPVVTEFTEPEIIGAVNGGRQLVWKDNRAGGVDPYDISTFFFSQNLTPGTPLVASYSTPAQTQPDAATNSNRYMVVFRSSVSGTHRIKVQPLDANGKALLNEPLLLDSGATLSDPAVAWNGSLYFVVWSEVGTPNLNDSVVWGQRILANGTLVDANPFPIMEGFSADVAAAGEVFLVVAIQQTITVEVREPFGVRVQGSTGQILDTPVDLGFSFARLPAVTGIGNHWLVTYQRNFSHDDANAEIRATFFEANGTVSESFIVASGLNPYFYNP